MRNIESRRIEGNGGHVHLAYDNGPVVTVENAHGETVATLRPDPSEAWDTFWHPFVNADVPNIFARFTRDNDEVQRGLADAEAFLAERAA